MQTRRQAEEKKVRRSQRVKQIVFDIEAAQLGLR
jgi:hypothetical protein